MSDIEVTSKLILQRDSWQQELQSAKADYQHFAQDISSRNVAINVVANDLITKQVDAIVKDLSTREVVINVRYQTVGDMPGGGPMAGVTNAVGGANDWRSAFNDIRAAQALQNDYRSFLSRSTAVGGPAMPYEMNDFTGGGEIGLAPAAAAVPAYSLFRMPRAGRYTPASAALTDAERAKSFDQEVNGLDPDRYVPTLEDIESAAEGPVEAGEATAGGSGRGFGGGMANRMMMRMMMMELIRAPIEHAAKQFEAYSKLDEVRLSGSSSQQDAAMLGVLRNDSDGVMGAISRPFQGLYGYDPSSLAEDLSRSMASIKDNNIVTDADRRGQIADMQSAADSAGPGAVRRSIERDIRYRNSVNAATDAAKRSRDELNPAGRRQDVEKQFAEESAPIHQSEGDDIEVGIEADAKNLAMATQNRAIRLKAIADREKAIDDARQKEIAAAEAARDAGAKDDAEGRAKADIRSRYDISGTMRVETESLGRAVGQGGAAETANFADKLREHTKELRDLAAATQDAAEKQRLLNQAQAEEAAMPGKVEAQKYAMQAKADEATERLQGMASRNRSASLRLGGNTLGASLNDIAESESNQKAELGRQRAAGLLTDEQYARGMQLAEAGAGTLADEAGKREARFTNRLRDEADDAGIVSPYARRRAQIRQQTNEEAEADPIHADLYRARGAAEQGRLDRDHGRRLADVLEESREQDLRTEHKTHLADVFELQRKMNDELADNEGDPAAQSAVRQKYASQARSMQEALNRKSYHTESMSSIHTGVLTAALNFDPKNPNKGNDFAQANNGLNSLLQNIKNADARAGHQGAGAGQGESGAGDAWKKWSGVADDLRDWLQNAPVVYTAAES